MRSLIEGRGKSFSRPFPSTCTHLHAYTHQLICRGTDRPMDSTDTFTQMWEHTQRHGNAIPLLYSEKEAWIQILALTSTETQTRAYIRLFGVSCRR